MNVSLPKLKLFWWNEAPNFGDALSPAIVEYVSGRGVEWQTMRECDLVALDSIMKQVRRSHNTKREGEKPWIWGTGSVGPHMNDFLSNVNIAAVRGPLTACLIGYDRISKGDPGLLVGEVYEGKLQKEKEYSVGVVLHHSQKASPEVLKFLENNKRSCLIDASDSNALNVVSKINACEKIISASLHGLVVADGLGVPNYWLDPMGIHQTARFKFYDYATSIGRAFPDPIPFAVLGNTNSADLTVETSYFDNLAGVIDNLRQAFPEELK